MTYWQVFNAHGAMYLAEGDSAEEAIENARPLFASNWLYGGPGLPPAPNPAYAQVGLTAVALTVGAGYAETLERPMPFTPDIELRRALWGPGRRPSPPAIPGGCYMASFGRVHVKPSCRCGQTS